MPTSADMDHMMDLMYGIPQDSMSLLPPAYTYVATAGTGSYGSVHFCLRSPSGKAVRANFKPSTDIPTVCERLTEQLVALKICVQPESIETLATELEALQVVEAYTKTDEGEACYELLTPLGHGTCLDGNSPYIVTSTLPIVCPLEDLKSHFLTLPEVFTWLVYAKVTNALKC